MDDRHELEALSAEDTPPNISNSFLE